MSCFTSDDLFTYQDMVYGGSSVTWILI